MIHFVQRNKDKNIHKHLIITYISQETTENIIEMTKEQKKLSIYDSMFNETFKIKQK